MLNRKIISSLAIILFSFLITNNFVNASSIDVSTRPASSGDSGPFTDQGSYRSAWNNLITTRPIIPAGYCNNTTIPDWEISEISDHGMCGGYITDISFHYHVNFGINSSQQGITTFRIAPDFGLGGEVFLDNVPISFNSNDMFWWEDWNNIEQI